MAFKCHRHKENKLFGLLRLFVTAIAILLVQMKGFILDCTIICNDNDNTMQKDFFLPRANFTTFFFFFFFFQSEP